MAEAISQHNILQFENNLTLLAQQTKSVLESVLPAKQFQGEGVRAVTNLGLVEMEKHPEANWKADTVWGNIDHFQRWLKPEDYTLYLALASEEELRLIASPQSSYLQSMVNAYKRTYDRIAIEALIGDVSEGKYNALTAKELPTRQKIADAGKGLTLNKIYDAMTLIKQSEVEFNKAYLLISHAQLTDLLKTEEQVGNMDTSQVKAFYNGELTFWGGFNLLQCERLPLVEGVRTCIAFTDGAAAMGMWNGFKVSVDKRPDKNNVVQIGAKLTLAGTRTEDVKVVTIDCKDETVIPAGRMLGGSGDSLDNEEPKEPKESVKPKTK